MDESGDLGFGKRGNSRYFVITFLCVQAKKPFEKIVSELHRTLKEKFRLRGGVLHATSEEPTTITRALKRLVENGNCHVMVAYLDKFKSNFSKKIQKHTLYNDMVRSLLDRAISQGLISSNEEFTFIASQRETNVYLNNVFKNVLESHISDKYRAHLRIGIKKPYEEKILQLVDIVSWSIMRKYEHNDNTFYKLIENLITEEYRFRP